MDAYYREYRASVHRGVYPIAALATEAYEARAREGRGVRRLDARRDRLHPQRDRGDQPRRVLVGLAPTSRAGDLIVITEMEHHSNLVPWQMLCERTGAELAYVPIDDEGLLIEDELDALLARGPKLVAVAHVSNVLGTINPIADIVARAHAAGAVVLVDGAQAAPHLPLDVARARRRLLRLDRAQGLRADRASACCTAAASCSRRCRRSSAAGT